jgi:hypothetical protein
MIITLLIVWLLSAIFNISFWTMLLITVIILILFNN